MLIGFSIVLHGDDGQRFATVTFPVLSALDISRACGLDARKL
jgi:hypothetical protein